MEDFKFVFSPLMTDIMLSDNEPLSYLRYGYLMKHQYCRLIKFSDVVVKHVIDEYVNGVNNVELCGNGSFRLSVDEIDFNIDELKEVVNVLCFKMSDIKPYDNGIVTFNVNSIFDEKEFEYNKRTIVSHD